MHSQLLRRALLLLLFLTVNFILVSQEVLLKEWQYRIKTPSSRTEWHNFSLEKGNKGELPVLKRGEKLLYRTELPRKELQSLLAGGEEAAIQYENLTDLTAIYLNGRQLYSSEEPHTLLYTILPGALIKDKNELTIELTKGYRSLTISPSLKAAPRLLPASRLKRENNILNLTYIVMALSFLITGLFLLSFFHRELKNYDYLLFSILCISFFYTTIRVTPIYITLLSESSPLITLLDLSFYEIAANFQPFIGLLMYRIMFKEEHPLIGKALIIMGVWTTLATINDLLAYLIGFMTITAYYLFIFYIMIIFILYMYIIIGAVRRKVPNIRYFLIGQGIFIISWIMQIIGELGPLPESPFYLNLGFFIYIYFIAFYLAKQFLKVNLDLKELNLTLNEKVKERTESLRESYRQKNDFFINLTHETKTPVMLIKNYLALHIKAGGSSKELDIAYRNACELERNMDNYMQLEKAVQKEQELYSHKSRLNLSSFIKERAALYPEENLELTLTPSLFIKANPEALKRLLDNLLSNALKYNAREVKIKVALKKRAGKLHLTVSDNGIGIAPEQQQHIFTPFYQASNKKMNIQGVGLGLSLVKAIVDSLEGTIELESAPGKGTGYKITLKEMKEGSLLDEPAIELNEAPSIPLPQHEEPIADSIYDPLLESILIVEDKPDTLSLLKRVFDEEYNIFTARDGAEAIGKLKELKSRSILPNLIISDIMMDNVDGYQFISLLKESSDFNYIPVIFLTAKSSKKEEELGYARGAVAYLTKPFSPEGLKAAVRANIESRESLLDDFEKSRINLTGFYKRCDHFGLSKVKKEILKQWIIDDLSQAAIADNIGRTKRTVEKHISEIKKMTGLENENKAHSALKKLFKEYI